MALTSSWILFSAILVMAGYGLSLIGMFNGTGYCAVLFVAFSAAAWPLASAWRAGTIKLRFRKARYTKAFPLLFLACFAFALVGGAIHPPTNYDAFCYRIPRILYWLDAGSYHWIGAFCKRMDFSSLGFEWLMVPGIAVFKTLRLAFLPNVFSYLLMPGLVYSSFRSLGVRGPVAAIWMWIVPCASCFAMEAGSIGNDFTATIYVLAAVTLSLKARQSGSGIHLGLAIISASLCTCAKVSNLPLMLPIGICVLAAITKHVRLWIAAACASVVALAVSFLPLAITNLSHAGDWTGSPGSVQNLSNPLMGIAGNALQLGMGSIQPSIFPPALLWNRWVISRMDDAPIDAIVRDFPELNLTTVEMATEEGAGLGLGVTGAIILAILASLRTFHIPRANGIGIWVAAGFWISLLTVMAKLGNPCLPRIIACYYPGILVLPLLLFDLRRIVHNRIWKTASFFLLLPVLPALAFNPARPILRPDQIATATGLNGNARLMERMKTVYEVYAERSDEHWKVREQLPADAVNIGFAGTDGDSSYSFWLPLGTRSVRDLTPVNGKKVPTVDGLDAIVASEWGTTDRFGLHPAEFAERIGWRIKTEIPIKRMARHAAQRWYVMVPADPDLERR